MKLKREIETTNAKYSLEDLNEEQFSFIDRAVSHYCYYITHRDAFDDETPLGELMSKIKKMKDSSITII